MKLKVLIVILVISVMALIVLSQIKRKAFALAEDFPREALVYVQVSNLPAFIRLWNESQFKEKYTKSENFAEFQDSHLGLKLASRWEEFNSATGFPIDLGVLSELSETSASIAIYDIGKLDFVFIAPVQEGFFAATKFVQDKDKFEEQTLDDGTILHRAKVEADRGRQKQEIIFTYVKGRFILTTSEKLLVKTLANIYGAAAKNNLSSEPSFKSLSEKAEPHLVTVWVNQTALNDDYYFKHYWLMPEAEKLKNIRAGIFDLSMDDGKLIERRTFLLDQKVNQTALETARVEKSLAYLPANIPFYHLQTATDEAINTVVQDTIFDRQVTPATRSESNHQYYFSNDFDDYQEQNYSYLNGKFDEAIDESDDNETITETNKTKTDFLNLLKSANPQTVLTFTEPRLLPAPLFAEFRRATVFSLESPANFNQALFESSLESALSAQLLISSSNAKLKWETKSENDVIWREINVPMLGWSACYTTLGNELILANNTSFLREVMVSRNSQEHEKLILPLYELTVLNLDQRENAYDQIFARFVKEKKTDNFFMGNITSLLDSASAIKRIEVKRSYWQNFLSEVVIINFR